MIALLEKKLNRPLQRAICLLHLNELPLRHLINYVDGTTNSPSSFSGPICKQLPKCHDLPLADFIRILCAYFPNIDWEIVKDLSSDQRYLYDICMLVMGKGDASILRKTPGPICHSRWLTTACRILRLYVSTSPNDQHYDSLLLLATFIIKVYAPIWFTVKQKPSVAMGAQHFFELVRRSRYLPIKYREKVDNVLRTNFFSGHSESILLAMLSDDSTKSAAIELIGKIRKLKRVGIREFRCPTFRFDHITSESLPTEYTRLIDLDSIPDLHEPPLTIGLSETELLNFEVPHYPAHTQAVERFIKLVTEASQHVLGEERRDGYIQTTTFSRRSTGKFDSKKDYKFAKGIHN